MDNLIYFLAVAAIVCVIVYAWRPKRYRSVVIRAHSGPKDTTGKLYYDNAAYTSTMYEDGSTDFFLLIGVVAKNAMSSAELAEKMNQALGDEGAKRDLRFFPTDEADAAIPLDAKPTFMFTTNPTGLVPVEQALFKRVGPNLFVLTR